MEAVLTFTTYTKALGLPMLYWMPTTPMGKLFIAAIQAKLGPLSTLSITLFIG